ncbi:hypothetical protein FRX31_012319, partial [Thalictrum thalictroides]
MKKSTEALKVLISIGLENMTTLNQNEIKAILDDPVTTLNQNEIKAILDDPVTTETIHEFNSGIMKA